MSRQLTIVCICTDSHGLYVKYNLTLQDSALDKTRNDLRIACAWCAVPIIVSFARVTGSDKAGGVFFIIRNTLHEMRNNLM